MTGMDTLIERLLTRAKTRNGTLVGGGDGDTYTVGYYSQADGVLDRAAATALQQATAERDEARGSIQSWQNTQRALWHQNHPGKEYADVHKGWWGGSSVAYDPASKTWFQDCVEAIIAALMQEGVIAWNGDATSIVAQMVLAQAQARYVAEAQITRLTAAFSEETEACAKVACDPEKTYGSSNGLADLLGYMRGRQEAAADILRRSRKDKDGGDLMWGRG